jgi:hypothetical protein
MEALNRDAAYLKEHPGAILRVEGHCDERGTSDYNLVLGDKRAKAARSYLIESGVSEKQVAIVSFGKERPFCSDHDSVQQSAKKLERGMLSRPLKSHSSAVPSKAAQRTAPELESHERRIQPRFTTQFRSSFSGQNKEGQGRTLDISSGGCKIESDMKVVQGATFECRLHVPGLDWPLRIDEATVRWVEGNTFGIAFTRISPEEVSKLETVLEDLESEE